MNTVSQYNLIKECEDEENIRSDDEELCNVEEDEELNQFSDK